MSGHIHIEMCSGITTCGIDQQVCCVGMMPITIRVAITFKIYPESVCTVVCVKQLLIMNVSRSDIDIEPSEKCVF